MIFPSGEPQMKEDRNKQLELMRFWLFGSLLIIFVAVAVYVGGALGTGLAILYSKNYWIALGVAIVLGVIWYFFYRWYIFRDKD